MLTLAYPGVDDTVLTRSPGAFGIPDGEWASGRVFDAVLPTDATASEGRVLPTSGLGQGQARRRDHSVAPVRMRSSLMPTQSALRCTSGPDETRMRWSSAR